MKNHEKEELVNLEKDIIEIESDCEMKTKRDFKTTSKPNRVNKPKCTKKNIFVNNAEIFFYSRKKL